MIRRPWITWIVSAMLTLPSCSESPEEMHPATLLAKSNYDTDNVIVVVIDGPRFSETWGHPERQYIPKMAEVLAPQGTFFENFNNEGHTRTVSGHSAITTGRYFFMANDGSEYPKEPSFFQYYLQHTKQPPDKAWIVSSKPKLNILADTRRLEWRGRYNPNYNCGKGGKKRPDAETLNQAMRILRDKEPHLMLLQFLGPDDRAHKDDWTGYLQSIQETDSLVFQLWQFLQTNEAYKDKTALLVTNDHGRHRTGHKDGFVSHGDNCRECGHISLLALGPDFERGKVVSGRHDLSDIAPTVAALIGFSFPEGDGSPIPDLLHAGP